MVREWVMVDMATSHRLASGTLLATQGWDVQHERSTILVPDKAEIGFKDTTYLLYVHGEEKENAGLATSCFFARCATRVQFWRPEPATLAGQNACCTSSTQHN